MFTSSCALMAGILFSLPASSDSSSPAALRAAAQTVDRECPYPCKASRPRIGLFDRRDVITVKLNNGLNVRAENGRLFDRAAEAGKLAIAADEWVTLTMLPVVRWEHVHDVPEAELTALCRLAAAQLEREVPDLNLQLFAYLEPGADAEAVLDRVNALGCVEMALPVPTPAPLPVPPVLDSRQDELLPAPTGIGSRAMWEWPTPIGGVAGSASAGRGAGVRVIDIEYSWNLSHHDLPTGIQVIGTPGADPFNDNNHGTAVLGEIGALENGWGTTGAAPAAELRVTSAIQSNGSYNVAAAITRAAAGSSAGDIILLEQQLNGPNVNSTTPTTQFGLVAVEWYRPNYDAIVVAGGAGRIIVEAAGNGQQNLDAASYQVGNGGHYPFRAANDSGAIIVGAGCPVRNASSTDRSRLWFSNYGSTVDVQGAGEAVFTLGYGDRYAAEGVNRYYTGTFGGTSSASPIVAAAAAIVQGSHEQLRGNILTQAQVRSALVSTGSAQQGGVYPLSQSIGPRPNATAATIAALGGADCNQTQIIDELEIIAAPVVTPAYPDRTVLAGEAVVLSVGVSGGGQGVTQRWWRGVGPDAVMIVNGPSASGTTFAGADTISLTISNTSLMDAGTYRCVISTPCNFTAEASVELIVNGPCLADANRDTVIGVQDIFVFLQYWFAVDTRADIDGRPGVSLEDLFSFLVAYFAGDCP